MNLFDCFNAKKLTVIIIMILVNFIVLRYLFECDNSELEGRTEFSEFSLTEAFVCMERIYKLLNTYTSSDKCINFLATETI